MFDLDHIQEHAIAIQKSIKEIDWHCKLVALHAQLAIGPIDGTRSLTQDQQAIVLGFLSEIQKHHPMQEKDLITLTGQILPALIDFHRDDIIRFELIAKQAVELAKNSLETISELLPQTSGKVGQTNGWTWLIGAYDIDQDTGEADPDSPWYVEFIDKFGERLISDDKSSQDEALSFANQFCLTHKEGYQDPDLEDFGVSPIFNPLAVA